MNSVTVFDGQEDAGGGRKSPAVCRKGKPPPAALLFFSICCPSQPHPEQEPAGRRAEHPPAPGDMPGAAVPGQEAWTVAQPQVFRDKEPHSWLCRHSPRWGSRRLTVRATALQGAHPGAVNGTPGLDRSHCIQAGHHSWAGLSPCPSLSPVLLLFCSLCLTNSLGSSWCLF